jgi:asparagine synthase (glutamine-hydrolysing)
MFAFALWDAEARILTLARDRMGEKPLYYGWFDHTLLFASELKAIRSHPAFRGELDRAAAASFLDFSYVPGPLTIFKNTWKLPPGTYLQISTDHSTETPVAYWTYRQHKRDDHDRRVGTVEMATQELSTALNTAVERQLMSDVPIGALLSGGIDSSLISAIMQSISSSPIKTFTIGFQQSSYNEACYARAVARHLGTEHHEFEFTGHHALTFVDQISDVYDEPFADISQLPTMFLMQQARQEVTVALSGDGADELFGGYSRYRTIPKLWTAMMPFPFQVRRQLGSALAASSFAAKNNKRRRLAAALMLASDSKRLYLSALTQHQCVHPLIRDVPPAQSALTDIERWPHDRASLSERFMAVDALTYLPDVILTKIDRAAMAASLETRAPFLDRDVVELSLRLPISMKIRRGSTKWILRRLLASHVPRELVDRPKMGFGIPIAEWLRGPLRDYAESFLEPRFLKDDPLLDGWRIARLWQDHVENRADNGNVIWNVLMLQAWRRAHAH